MKKLLKLIILVILAIGIGWYAKDNLNLFARLDRVDAVGALTVNLGVPDGSPIFTFNNILPGFSQNHTVTVNNGDSVARQVGIKGFKTAGTGNLESQLDIVISENGTDLYGGTSTTGAKTLEQFFTDSSSVNGVALSTVNPGVTTAYLITVTFKNSAGNAFQNTNVVFDLKFGIITQVPLACEGINFSANSPIFGTAGNDSINGTNGNDLIITFEGNDNVNSGNGRDCVILGDGVDRANTGNGQDIVLGEAGIDTINSGNDADIVFAGDDNDRVDAGVGNDTVHGDAGNDSLNGGAGNDSVMGDLGDDQLDGSSGNDSLIGGEGQDVTDGSSGSDSCSAESKMRCETSL